MLGRWVCGGGLCGFWSRDVVLSDGVRVVWKLQSGL